MFNNRWGKLKNAFQKGNACRLLLAKIKSELRGTQWIFHDPSASSIQIHYPQMADPLNDDKEIEYVQRIFSAYKKMKEDQKKIPDYHFYLPSSLWQSQLDKDYSSLQEGIQHNDLRRFHYFLANFGVWKTGLGLESTIIRENLRPFWRKRYLINEVFGRQLAIWKWFYPQQKPLSELTYPMYGNQAGAYIEGNFTGVGSFFSEIYGSLLYGLINDQSRTVLAELGAGYGKLAFFILRNLPSYTYIDFDLPETLCLAAYFLIKAFPDKSVLLYGEEPYSTACHKNFDFIFMPSFEIRKITERSIDLFLNKNSLGEMNQDAVKNYLRYITYAAEYFFHMNHEHHRNQYEEEKAGLLAYEYPIEKEAFRLLFRYPDIGNLLYEGRLNFNADIWMYLYRRK